MKKIIYIIFVGLLGLLFACEKDGTRIIMLDDPITPSIVSLPNLTLVRDNGGDTLEFVGTPVDPGFNASATYFLQADFAGSGFTDPLNVYSDVQVASMKMAVSDLNEVLIKKFPEDAVSSIDFRIRAVLVVDGGTGAPGTGTDPFEYFSEAMNADVTLYGFPRLDLLNSGIDQKIISPLGDGIYSGFVKLDAANPFTLFDPETSNEYGANGAVLQVDGAAFTVATSGWHSLSADINDLTYDLSPYMIGLVGSATPNGWDVPDQKMEYDYLTNTWVITIDLVDGDIKFRKNDDWTWNLGGTTDNLVHNGANYPVTAGNYTIALTITSDADETGTFTIVKNN